MSGMGNTGVYLLKEQGKVFLGGTIVIDAKSLDDIARSAVTDASYFNSSETLEFITAYVNGVLEGLDCKLERKVASNGDIHFTIHANKMGSKEILNKTKLDELLKNLFAEGFEFLPPPAPNSKEFRGGLRSPFLADGLKDKKQIYVFLITLFHECGTQRFKIKSFSITPTQLIIDFDHKYNEHNAPYKGRDKKDVQDHNSMGGTVLYGREFTNYFITLCRQTASLIKNEKVKPEIPMTSRSNILAVTELLTTKPPAPLITTQKPIINPEKFTATEEEVEKPFHQDVYSICDILKKRATNPMAMSNTITKLLGAVKAKLESQGKLSPEDIKTESKRIFLDLTESDKKLDPKLKIEISTYLLNPTARKMKY